MTGGWTYIDYGNDVSLNRKAKNGCLLQVHKPPNK